MSKEEKTNFIYVRSTGEKVPVAKKTARFFLL